MTRTVKSILEKICEYSFVTGIFCSRKSDSVGQNGKSLPGGCKILAAFGDAARRTNAAFEQPGVCSVTGIEQGAVFGNFESKGRGQGFRLWVRGKDTINTTPHLIKISTDTTVERIEAGKVTGHTIVRKRNRKTKCMETVKDEIVAIPADVIIYAGGAKPNDSTALYAAAYKYNIPCIAIGSAVLDRDDVAAIHEGNALGRTL